MRYATAISAAFVLSACSGTSVKDSSEPTVQDTSTGQPSTGTTATAPQTGATTGGTTTSPTSTGDTGFWWSLAQDGHVALVHRGAWIGGSERVLLSGVFVDDDRSVKNLANCVSDAFAPCFDALPTIDDDWIAPSGARSTEFQVGLDMGPLVSLGAYSAATVFGGIHYQDVQSEPWVSAAVLPLNLDPLGVWGAYAGTDEVATVNRLGSTQPGMLDRLQPDSSDTLEFRWSAGTGGPVYLYFRAGSLDTPQEERLYKLQDDGAFDLDLAPLGLSSGTPLTVQLWSEIARDRVVNGHHLRGLGLSEQRWAGETVAFGARTRLDPSLDCASAQAAPLLTAGGYYGSLSGAAALLDPGFFAYNCTGRSAMGVEGLYRFELAPGESISVDYDLVGADGSIYVVSDCFDAGSCDRGFDEGVVLEAERLEYANTTSATVERFLVVDTHLDGQTLPGTLFTMDVFFSTVVADSLPEDCTDAAGSAPLGPGSYTVSLDAYQNDLVLLASQCTQTEASGHDAMFRVEVGPGELVEVSTAEDGTELALVDDCTDASTCLIGSIGVPESVAWYNAGSVSEVLTVVLGEDGDSRVPSLFTLDIATTVPLVDLWPGDCAAAELAVPELPGVWSVPLSAYADDVDPGAGVCASVGTPGPDATIPISVAPGEYLYVWTETPGVQLWLWDDCTATTSCHNPEPAMDLSFVEHVNATATPQVVFLTLDHDGVSPLPALVDVNSVAAPVPVADAAADCAALSSVSVLDAGVHYGTLVNAPSGLDPGPSGCTGVDAPSGEALLRVELQPGEGIDASLPDPFGQQLYLVSDCTDPATCVVGAQAMPGPARVVWANTSTGVEAWTLVVDGGPGLTSPVYRLEVDIGPMAPLLDADTCADAQTLPALGNGSWFGSDLTGWADELNPGTSGCTGTELGGPDSMVPLHLNPGDLASIQAVGGDALYAVTDCLDPTTCAAASTLWAGEPRLAIDNPTAAPWDGFVIVDTESLGEPYTLEVHAGPATAFTPSDTCTGAAAQIPLATGLHLGTGSLAGFSNFLNPAVPGPSCTGGRALGAEGIVTVEVGAGETLEATVNQTGGDGVLYLLEACMDVTSCVAGDDQWDAGGIGGDWPEQLNYTNTSGVSEMLYLVLDGYTTTGEFYLQVEIGP